MASHKKHTVFLRITTSNNIVSCVNPLQLASFTIVEKAKVRVKDKELEADTIYFYFPNGTETKFSVGVNMTQEEFYYVSNTLTEYLYLNEHEFRAKTEAIEKAKLAQWNSEMDALRAEAEAIAEPKQEA